MVALNVVHAACPHDCPDTCAIAVTTDGAGAARRAIKVEGDTRHADTAGFLCAKVSKYLERVYDPRRVLHPFRRCGKKGEGRFVRITWDEAIAEITGRWKDMIAIYGPQCILPYSYAGTMGLVQGQGMDRRFFHRMGASLLARTICATAGAAGYKATIGASIGMEARHFAESKFILIWGSNPVTSNVHLWRYVLEARKRGARVVTIDPYRTRTAAASDEHLALIPGTDAALALAMMRVIVDERLYDADYVARHTLGFEALCERLQTYTPAGVAPIVGLDEATIVRLAHAYARTQPSAIRVNYGLQRHAGGGMAVRTIACLPALVGAWRHPAGGILLSTSGTFPLNYAALERPDWIPPGTRTINMTRLGEALTNRDETGRPAGFDPPVMALYVYNSNPAAIAPDQNQVLAGLCREDLFTVVHEQFFTDTTDYADIVLPATTQLEHMDVVKPYGHLSLMFNEPAIPPLGEAKSNSDVFRRLAQAMGYTEPELQESDEQLIRAVLDVRHPWMEGLTFERLRAEGYVRLNLPSPFAPFAEGGFPTPSGKCEFYSESLARQGMDPLPAYVPPRENVHSNPPLAARYPLALISPPAHNFLNSTFVNQDSLRRVEKEPLVELHPSDAGPRGIRHGQMVRVFNDRGAFCVRARVSERIRPGVAYAPGVWWARFSPDGRNVNAITGQALTDLGGGATFYDVLVEVEPLDAQA
ncbi:molybdopterin oxidoreductase family protein [Chloracidobacterium sp. MS 40/45]|uniref:molybdopterin-containing oxidoreductase family protein n=1 Tax=Chloracidobacterium aggregatum TaxID=2851959 RepID=UPI001B8B30D3|nr:molybdopterin oxidoreductase family protein [Chloracidobacterium aggregatum]QUW00582.1 molybdopterin oxidoreductase family protein [Chloracidobacterium sp. MS 40/45]